MCELLQTRPGARKHVSCCCYCGCHYCRHCDFLAKSAEIKGTANKGREMLRNAILIVQSQMFLIEKMFMCLGECNLKGGETL